MALCCVGHGEIALAAQPQGPGGKEGHGLIERFGARSGVVTENETPSSAACSSDSVITLARSPARLMASCSAPLLGHVDLVRHLFFGGLPKELLAPLSQALEAIHAHVLEHGTLPAPASEP